MCTSRYDCAISVAVSIVVGIVLSLLGFFAVLTATLLAPILGLILSALVLLLLTIAATTLLRQNTQYNVCMCRRARQLLLGAIWLLVFAAFAVSFAIANPIVALILNFFIYTLFSYTVFSLYCWLRCLAVVGCTDETGC